MTGKGEEEWIKGRCYCGEVRFEVKNVAPRFSLYCHCSDCRRAHGASVYSTFLTEHDNVRVTQGEEHMKKYMFQPTWAKYPCSSRTFCSNCGSRLFNEMRIDEPFMPGLEAGDYRGVLPGNLETTTLPEHFKPTMHLFCNEAIMPLPDDGLPHFPTVPGRD